MATKKIANQTINEYYYNTVVIGAGGAGMNSAKKLYEYMSQKGIENPEDRIAVITAGLPLGASRMSGSDKQTYYKMGTSPDIADSAEEFAKSLTAGGCCHGDLALAEAIGSLRGFYNLVEAGVPFPNDNMGVYIGYKTDHDPYERATSAGPKTSKFMSECLEKIVRRYGVKIYDGQEAAEFITEGEGENKRIRGVVTIDRKNADLDNYAINVFYFENVVMAAGGPGALYETSVYPLGQTGIHGLALKAGMAGENITELQFGLASTKFRWNVSGTYMQVVPRIFSTDADGNDEKEFLTDFFPSMSKMATDIFLKGYQWPFDPQRIENLQSSLIDVIVFNETQKGRRVFMDFLKNPIGNESMDEFKIEDLEDEALDYLKATGALQSLPIERLQHMNPPAIDIYTEHNIDLYKEPLEIAVCAQHSNGGFGINKWWESNIKHTFVIGEMAGSHGVKRPGGSALNAGQVGAQRSAEFIVNAYCNEVPAEGSIDGEGQIKSLIENIDAIKASSSTKTAADNIAEIQSRMTKYASHIRRLSDATEATKDAVKLYKEITENGVKVESVKDLIDAVQVRHLSLASAAFLKAIVELISQGSGSRGSHMVISADGLEIHPDIVDTDGTPLKFKPENEELRKTVIKVSYDASAADMFKCETIPVRPAPTDRKAFEPAWEDFREGRIYKA
ncbi:MAG: FAD-binding protein [Sedimentisphaeraceae bacterium JB056]